MRRTRHQQGWITDGSRKGAFQLHWVEYVLAEDGTTKRVHRSETGSFDRKYKAQERLDEIVASINPNAAKRDGNVTLEWFTENRWRPLRQWRETTLPTNVYKLNLIYERFGKVKLNELDKVDMQLWLNQIAKERSRDNVWHIRSFLKSICEEAVEQDYLAKNPAKGLMRPATKERDSTLIEWSQYRAVLSALTNPRDKLVVEVASACAVRPSELFGFKWRDLRKVDGERYVLDVRETVCQGKVRDYGKTKGSKNTVALPAKLAQELIWWRSVTKHAGDDDYIFASSTGGFVHARNFLMRTLKPIRKSLKLSRLTFQVMRRTFATRAQDLASTTSISRQLRHEKTATTLENYIKPLDESVFDMVDEMYDEMNKEQVN